MTTNNTHNNNNNYNKSQWLNEKDQPRLQPRTIFYPKSGTCPVRQAVINYELLTLACRRQGESWRGVIHDWHWLPAPAELSPPDGLLFPWRRPTLVASTPRGVPSPAETRIQRYKDTKIQGYKDARICFASDIKTCTGICLDDVPFSQYVNKSTKH